MELASFITVNKEEIIGRWVVQASQRFSFGNDERPQLIDHLPNFLEELAEALNMERAHWMEKYAREHGKQRIQQGVNIGTLAEEFGLVLEVVISLAGERSVALAPGELCWLVELISRGAAESVREYAELRDQQLNEIGNAQFTFMAHEVRSPLQTARLAVSLLQQGRGDRDKLLARLDRAHSRLVELVDNSLVEARLVGRPTPQYEQVDLAALLASASESVVGSAELKQVGLECDLAVTELSADPRLLLSVLINLISNSIKFSPAGGVVTVRSRREEGQVRIEVEDQCGGIPEEKVPHLFEPFTQAGTDRSGFGLGLMIVKQAIEAHGGSVQVDNHPGTGCCFAIVLPAYS